MRPCCCFKNTLNPSVQEVKNLITSASESPPSHSGCCLHLFFGSLWSSRVTLYKQKRVSTLLKCVQTGFWNKNYALRKLLPVLLGCHPGVIPHEEGLCNWLKVGCQVLFWFLRSHKKCKSCDNINEMGWFYKGNWIPCLLLTLEINSKLMYEK